MVKVYKISGFLADPNYFLNEEEVRERLESLEDLFPSGIEIVEKKWKIGKKQV